MNKNFLFSNFSAFFRAQAILEPQVYVLSEQIEAENIPLLNGRLDLVTKFILRFPF